jgi:hypothetical protein
MFNSVALNVVIGLVFIYLLYSLLATIIQELIATNLGMRGKILKKGISRMLDDGTAGKFLSQVFYEHPLIKYLAEKENPRSKPSYLSAQNFSKVFTDLLRGENVQPGQDLRVLIQQALDKGETQWVNKIGINGETLSYLRSIWADSQGDVEKFKALLEQWFDDTMARASGWYKKQIQMILFLIGLIIAVVFNVDTISITKKLSTDPKLAAQLADNAAAYMETHKDLGTQLRSNQEKLMSRLDAASKSPAVAKADTGAANDTRQVTAAKTDSVRAQDSLSRYYADMKIEHETDSISNYMVKQSNTLIDSANAMINSEIKNVNQLLGLGWSCHCPDKGCCKPTICIAENFHWWSLIGWLVTALAISLGAPFWFDLLNKLVKMRGAGKAEDSNSSKEDKAQKETAIKPKG